MTHLIRSIVCSAALLALAGCGSDKSSDKAGGNPTGASSTAANAAGADTSGATSTGPETATATEPARVPLKLYWSQARGDNFTTGTEVGEQSAIASQYQYIREEGRAYSAPTARHPALVPLLERSARRQLHGGQTELDPGRRAARLPAHSGRGPYFSDRAIGDRSLAGVLQSGARRLLHDGHEGRRPVGLDSGYQDVGIEGYVFEK